MTFVRTRIYPFALACALLALGGCGLIPEGPTDATLATMNGLQAITEAIGTAVLPPDVADTSLPYAVSAPVTPDEGEFAAFARQALAALGGTSQPMATVDFLGIEPTPCAVGDGTVTLTGTADVTDLRNPAGHGLVTIVFGTTSLGTMSAVADACVGYGHQSSGNLTAGANATITVTHWADPDIDRWLVDRDEIAGGTLTVTKISTGATHSVTFSWRRVGSLDLTVDGSGLTPYVELLGQTQSVYLTVNGQTCTGHYTGHVVSLYDWDCSGG